MYNPQTFTLDEINQLLDRVYSYTRRRATVLYNQGVETQLVDVMRDDCIGLDLLQKYLNRILTSPVSPKALVDVNQLTIDDVLKELNIQGREIAEFQNWMIRYGWSEVEVIENTPLLYVANYEYNEYGVYFVLDPTVSSLRTNIERALSVMKR